MKLMLHSTVKTRPDELPLEYSAGYIKYFFLGVEEVLFVPYALKNCEVYFRQMEHAFWKVLGLKLTSIHHATSPRRRLMNAEAVYVGGGNTFLLKKRVEDAHLGDLLAERVRNGMLYMGSSAGANLACPTVKTTNDMPIVQPASLEGLGLVPFQINPHYQATSAYGWFRRTLLRILTGPPHMGEPRERRIQEYHEHNTLPVLGMREGSFLLVEDERTMYLGGSSGARLFRPPMDPQEFNPRDDLSFLLL